MTATQLARRLERIEARRNPGAVFVCFCNLTGNSGHAPDCPAATAGPHDNVVIVRYADGGAGGVNNWQR